MEACAAELRGIRPCSSNTPNRYCRKFHRRILLTSCRRDARWLRGGINVVKLALLGFRRFKSDGARYFAHRFVLRVLFHQSFFSGSELRASFLAALRHTLERNATLSHKIFVCGSVIIFRIAKCRSHYAFRIHICAMFNQPLRNGYAIGAGRLHKVGRATERHCPP